MDRVSVDDDIILSYQDVTLRIAAQTDGPPPQLKVMLENRMPHCIASFPLRDVRQAFECFCGLSRRHGSSFEKKVGSFLVIWSIFLERNMNDFKVSWNRSFDENPKFKKRNVNDHIIFLSIRTEYVRILREIQLVKKNPYETRPSDDQSKWMRKIMEKFVESQHNDIGGLDG